MVSGKKHFAVTALMAALLLAASSCTTTLRRIPDHEQRLEPWTTVAIVTPDVTVIQLDAEGNTELQTDEEQAKREELVEVLSAKLTSKGFALCESPIDPWLTDSVHGAYRLVVDRLYQDGVSVDKESADQFEECLATAISSLPADTDAILCVRAVQIDKSAGRIAAGFLGQMAAGLGYALGAQIAGGTPTSPVISAPSYRLGLVDEYEYGIPPHVHLESWDLKTSVLVLSLVDARNGDVVWTNRVDDSWSLASMAKAALGKLPPK